MRFLRAAIRLILSWVALIAVSCVSGDPGSAGLLEAEAMRSIELRIGVKDFIVEVAEDDLSRHAGLMGRTELSDTDGMLFVYPDERIRAFWMKDTLIPLSLAFVDAAGIIISIHEMRPGSRDPVVSERPASYVIELALGEFSGAGVVPGDIIQDLLDGIE